MALRMVEGVELEPRHPTTARLEALRVELEAMVADALGGVDDESAQADLVDQIALGERLRAGVAAVQAALTVRFARARVDAELARDVHPRDVGRGVAEEIGLACRISSFTAARRLASARAWWFDLPHTYAALASGEVSEQVAETVVTHTDHLDAERRRLVDARLHAAGLAGRGRQEAEKLVRTTAYEVDRQAYVDRGRHARKDRRVGLRAAPDTMSVLSGYLPVEQGVACLAALKQHTDAVVATGDPERRTRSQIMADTLVERLTGQTRASNVNVEVQIVIGLDTLTDDAAEDLDESCEPAGDGGMQDETGTDPDDEAEDASAEDNPSPVPGEGCADAPLRRTGVGSALLSGWGPLPAALARELIDTSRGRKRWRAVFASKAGRLVGIGKRRRRFTGPLADLIATRDQTCREPACDAPIRHLDHVERYRDGGETTGPNGRGLCARHNYVRERPGWHAVVVHDGLGTEPHTVRTTTPTGHAYESRAPDPP